uniref:Retrovirus-related Pol polyprotein from transposon TNT 1-94 n=1 Tax=Panagrellus redivivus TaxID=6233 RepID=A0A7E4V4L1_PANRE
MGRSYDGNGGRLIILRRGMLNKGSARSRLGGSGRHLCHSKERKIQVGGLPGKYRILYMGNLTHWNETNDYSQSVETGNVESLKDDQKFRYALILHCIYSLNRVSKPPYTSYR